MQDIEEKKGSRFSDYADEFDYLINAGIALEVKAISNPVYPLKESESKNLLKLYLSDVGLLTNILYGANIVQFWTTIKASIWVLCMKASLQAN